MSRWIFVISDLHIGEGQLDDFDKELEDHLVSFIQSLGLKQEPVELVINGDFIDFVQATPWLGADLESTTDEGIPLCFTEAQSVAKFLMIKAAHEPVFLALRDFLTLRYDNRLVVLPGNHDADLFWPKVQRYFREAICPKGCAAQFELCLARHYRPAGSEWLWIEHGHQLDPVNSFIVGGEERWSRELPPIFSARDGTRRLLECTGTRFLVRYLNRLDARYPYVDNVKPFSRFLRIFGASALTPGWGPLDATVSVGQMLSYLTRTAITRPTDLMRVDEKGIKVDDPLRKWIMEVDSIKRTRFLTSLKARGLTLSMPLDMALEKPDQAANIYRFLSENPDLVEGLGESPQSLLGESEGTLKLADGFFTNETEDLLKGAADIASREKVTAVVMGHTHEPVQRASDFTYLNTGSWTRYYHFSENQRTQPWRVLRERSYERFPYRLSAAVVRPGALDVVLDTWRERSSS